MKYLSLIRRREDFTHEAFRHYYENQHAPLALGFFPPQLYRRNYADPSVSVGFDCLCEFAYPDDFDIEAAMATPAGPALAEDESRFIERECTRTARALLLCGEPLAPRPLTDRELWLIPVGNADRLALTAAFKSLPAQSRNGACLEALQPHWCSEFPYAALLSLESPMSDSLPSAFSALGTVRLKVASCASLGN